MVSNFQSDVRNVVKFSYQNMKHNKHNSNDYDVMLVEADVVYVIISIVDVVGVVVFH